MLKKYYLDKIYNIIKRRYAEWVVEGEMNWLMRESLFNIIKEYRRLKKCYC